MDMQALLKTVKKQITSEMKDNDILRIIEIVSRKILEDEFSGKQLQEPTSTYLKTVAKTSTFSAYTSYISKDIIVNNLTTQATSRDLFSNLLKVTGLPIHFLAEEIFEITAKTLSRYKNEDRKIPALFSELALKIIELYKTAEEIFGSNKLFNNWLMETNPMMDNKKPVDYLKTSTGTDLLFEELKRIEFGATA